jgi:hypothetical protein
MMLGEEESMTMARVRPPEFPGPRKVQPEIPPASVPSIARPSPES